MHLISPEEKSMRKTSSVIVLALVAALVCAASMWAAPSEALLGAVDAYSKAAYPTSQAIWSYKELGQQEFKSSALLKKELEALGFTVKTDLPVPADLIPGGIAKTAFRAEFVGKRPGPTVTIMLEYDALANGHSCGHNLIATSGLMAAAALSKMPDLPGRILVIGTPDEERGSRGGGKIALLEGGNFEGTDFVLITHPGNGTGWSLDQRMLAMRGAKFNFKGLAAHAAMAPHEGISALDAVVLTFNATDMLREHLRQDVRIHGIITKGGVASNIVPAEAEADFSVRALDTATMDDAYRKVVNCAKAGALATGATLNFVLPRTALLAPITVPEYRTLVSDTMAQLGLPMAPPVENPTFGSSDLGNVGYAYPTFNISFPVPVTAALHSDLFAAATNGDAAWDSAIQAAKVVSLTAWELLNDPAKLESIKKTFNVMKGK
jgi:amidohydrolase